MVMRRPPDVNPAEFDAAMRPEAGDPWEPLPHACGYWIASLQYGWLGPFPSSDHAWDRADTLTYTSDWQIVNVDSISNVPPIFLSPF